MGVFVTRTGYDSGAKKFADYYGISLQEARIPDSKDWEGRFKDTYFNLVASFARVTDIRADFDQQWLQKNKGEIIEDLIPTFISGLSNEISIYSSAGDKITDFFEMEKSLPRNLKEEQGLTRTYKFDDGYLDILDFGKVKVSQVEFTYDVVCATINEVIRGEEIAKAILKDVKTGEIKFFDKNGSVK